MEGAGVGHHVAPAPGSLALLGRVQANHPGLLLVSSVSGDHILASDWSVLCHMTTYWPLIGYCSPDGVHVDDTVEDGVVDCVVDVAVLVVI